MLNQHACCLFDFQAQSDEQAEAERRAGARSQVETHGAYFDLQGQQEMVNAQRDINKADEAMLKAKFAVERATLQSLDAERNMITAQNKKLDGQQKCLDASKSAFMQQPTLNLTMTRMTTTVEMMIKDKPS